MQVSSSDESQRKKLVEYLKEGKIYGLKFYPGYEDFYPYDEILYPLYKVKGVTQLAKPRKIYQKLFANPKLFMLLISKKY